LVCRTRPPGGVFLYCRSRRLRRPSVLNRRRRGKYGT
jgi:hypothetical protein